MAKEKALSPEQRAKYEEILKSQGKEAAESYKKKIVAKATEAAPKKEELSPQNKKFKKDFKQTTKVGEDLGLFNENLISSPGVSALVDPNNPAFIGKPSEKENAALEDLQSSVKTNPDGSAVVSPTEQLGLNVLQEAVNKAGITSPEVKDLFAKLTKDYEEAGVRSPEMAEALTMMKDNVINAGKEDARLTSALSVMEQGLMGLSSPENQALREKSQREVKGKVESATRNLEDSIARNRVSGGASLAAQRQLDQMGIESAQKAEQDLLLANVDIQDKRRKEYADTLMTNDKDKKTAVNNALGTYGGTLTTTEATESSAKNAAAKNLSEAVTSNDATIKNAVVAASGNLGSVTASVGNAAEQRLNDAKKAVAQYIQEGDFKRAQALIDTLGLDIDISEFNSGENTAKQGAKVGFYSGVKGIDIAEKTADATTKLASRPDGGGGGSSPNTSGISARIKDIEDTVNKKRVGK